MSEPGHAAWSCVEVEPRDAQGLCRAKLSLAVTPGCSHNRLVKVAPEVIFIDVGVSRKQGRVNVELLGFIAFLLDLGEDQVRIESGAEKKGKVVELSGLKQDKRQLIWSLERKVGERHEAHFALDNINAARQFYSKEAVKRRAELDEFQSAKEEVRPAASSPMSNLLLGPPPSKKALTASWAAKRADAASPRSSLAAAGAGEKCSAVEGAAEASESAPAAAGASGGIVSAGAGGGEDGAGSADVGGGGLGGLAAYSSDDEESEDDEEKPALPPPEL